jgi:catechol 2,3-dioxygenase-like lactoylglutathione lyase family enzyme
MSSLRIEHVNITVANPERSSVLMQDLFDWHIRWSGPALNGGHSIQVGSDDHYVALYGSGAPELRAGSFNKGEPLNHIGVEVEDLDAVEARVIAAGLVPFSHGDYAPGRRFYFLDRDGIEFEVVSYSKS